jgi:beta-lactam-binding protein with PASTA domain
MTNPAKPLSDLEQMKVALGQAVTELRAEIDATQTGEVLQQCDTALIEFEDIDKKTGDTLETYRRDAVNCVTAAKNQIAAQSTPSQIEVNALALNIGAPMALAASVKAGDSINLLQNLIIEGNRTLLDKPQLKPTCGITPNDPDAYNTIWVGQKSSIHGNTNAVAIQGHGVCYNYLASPLTTLHGVPYLPTGKNTGALPWSVIGEGQLDICGGIFTCGTAHINWPSTTTWNYSMAVDQAMATTSYPVVKAALDKLDKLAVPNSRPMTMITNSKDIYSPIEVFAAKPSGELLRGVVADSPGDPTVHRGTFQTWSAFDGPAFSAGNGGPGFRIRSLASVYSWDGRMQLFGTTPDGKLVTRYQVLNTVSESAGEFVAVSSGIHPARDSWVPWQTVPTDGPVAQVAALTGVLVSVYIIKTDGTLQSRTQNVSNGPDFNPIFNNWKNWQAIPSPEVGGVNLPARTIQVFVDQNGNRNLLATAGGSQQFQLIQDSDWVQIPGTVYGGFAAVKEGGGNGGNEMFGIDKDGKVLYNASTGGMFQANGTWWPDPWDGWIPVNGAVLRPYEPGPGVGPVLDSVTQSGGNITLSWTDKSTNEDSFVVQRYTVSGQPGAQVTEVTTTDRAGSGKAMTFTDTAPSTSAPCYVVKARDAANSFNVQSDIVCQTPSVIGLTTDAATSSLTAAAFSRIVMTVNNCVNTGTVQYQTPTVGAWSARVSAVTILVSTCIKPVPNVMGLSQAAARDAITQAGFKVNVTNQANCVDPADTVVAQDPKGGLAMAVGVSTIHLQVAACTAVVPNLVGTTEIAARAAITNANLTLGTISSITRCADSGKVVGQSLAAGTTQPGFTKINITVATCSTGGGGSCAQHCNNNPGVRQSTALGVREPELTDGRL